MKALLPRYTLGLALPFFAACQSSVDSPEMARPQPGTYLGDHGKTTRTGGVESELVLGEDGGFRYFLVDSNTAYFTSKGSWTASGRDMVWAGVARSFLIHGGFRKWDTLDFPDTSYLRNVTDSGFQRLEATFDSLFTPVVHWVSYRRITPVKALPDGVFEFRETYPDQVDTTKTIAGLTRLEIDQDGHYIQKIFRNGDPYMTDVDSSWTQAGTHLITTRNRHCDHEPGRSLCADAPPGYEYIARLAQVGDSTFNLWMAPDFTFQADPFWAGFRTAPREK